MEGNGEINGTWEENVKCTLEPGDYVQIRDFWGPQLSGKRGKVISVRRYRGCESGFMVSTDITTLELDANWFIKLNNLF
jgi:hypothetical protein